MAIKWFGKKKESYDIYDAIREIKLVQGEISLMEKNLEGQIKTAKREAEEAFRKGDRDQFRRHARNYGESAKKLKLIQAFSAEIGNILDTLILCKSFQNFESITSLLYRIYEGLRLKININDAIEAMSKLNEELNRGTDRLSSIENIRMIDEDFSDIEKELIAEFKAKMETEKELNKKAEEKIDKLKED